MARFDAPEIRVGVLIHSAGGTKYEGNTLSAIAKLLASHPRTANCKVTKITGTEIRAAAGAGAAAAQLNTVGGEVQIPAAAEVSATTTTASISRSTTESGRGLLSETCDVLYVPGGSVFSQQADLGQEGWRQVLQFVRGGGGYVGVCAGALLAGQQGFDAEGVNAAAGMLGATTAWCGWLCDHPRTAGVRMAAVRGPATAARRMVVVGLPFSLVL